MLSSKTQKRWRSFKSISKKLTIKKSVTQMIFEYCSDSTSIKCSSEQNNQKFSAFISAELKSKMILLKTWRKKKSFHIKILFSIVQLQYFLNLNADYFWLILFEQNQLVQRKLMDRKFLILFFRAVKHYILLHFIQPTDRHNIEMNQCKNERKS